MQSINLAKVKVMLESSENSKDFNQKTWKSYKDSYESTKTTSLISNDIK